MSFDLPIIIKFHINLSFSRNKDTNATTTVTYCMEKWSTVENAGDQNIKHRAMISIFVAVLQVWLK